MTIQQIGPRGGEWTAIQLAMQLLSIAKEQPDMKLVAVFDLLEPNGLTHSFAWAGAPNGKITVTERLGMLSYAQHMIAASA